MISEHDKAKIVELAKKYEVSRILLFGSSIESVGVADDIDLAVEGIAESNFFKFYAELIFSLSQPVDLIDIKKESRFRDMILAEGIVLYG